MCKCMWCMGMGMGMDKADNKDKVGNNIQIQVLEPITHP
jgi:hypothetical protein